MSKKTELFGEESTAKKTKKAKAKPVKKARRHVKRSAMVTVSVPLKKALAMGLIQPGVGMVIA